MRDLLTIMEETQDPTALVRAVVAELLEESGETAQQFNCGNCFEFSDAMESRYGDLFDSFELGNFYNHETGDCDDATGFGEKWLEPYPEWQPPTGLTWDDLFNHWGFNWTGMHGWAFCKSNRLCYDVEAPDGVKNVLDLPFFKRVLAHPADPPMK